MNDAPIQIRNPEVTRAIRALASRKGQPITNAVADLVNAELSRLEAAKEAEVQRRLALINEAVERFNALPIVGPLLTDDDLYDEDGFAK
jgi:antitoxin VapB